ncbi:MAG: hypothetical protein LBJ60_04160 [Tannerellaceae bacterium]|nr:hypothetical protein [Tannerellaceae bacterium]
MAELVEAVEAVEATGAALREGLQRIARNEPQASEDLQRKARPPPCEGGAPNLGGVWK